MLNNKPRHAKNLDGCKVHNSLYEFDQPWYEVNDKTANVNLATGTVEYAHSVPAGAAPGSRLCSNRACYDPNYSQCMPRVGFAYQVNPRLVVRGGYGATSFFEGNAGIRLAVIAMARLTLANMASDSGVLLGIILVQS